MTTGCGVYWRQTNALIRAHFQRKWHNANSTFFVDLFWPLLFLILFSIYKLTGHAWSSVENIFLVVVIMCPTLIIRFYRNCSAYLNDEDTKLKFLMLSMGLKRFNYFIAYFLIFLIEIAIIWIPTLIFAFATGTIEILSLNAIYLAIALPIQAISLAMLLSTFLKSPSITFLLAFSIPFIALFLKYQDLYSSSSYTWFLLFFVTLNPLVCLLVFCTRMSFMAYTFFYTTEMTTLILSFVYSSVMLPLALYIDCIWPFHSEIKGMNPLFCCYSSDTIKTSSHEIEDSIRIPKSEKGPSKEPNAQSDASKDWFEKRETIAIPALSVNNITKYYDGHPVIQDLSMQIYSGEITLLLGHNGAGKSTLMNIILGKTDASKGFVSLNNVNTDDGQFSIGVCPQDSILDPDLTVQQHIELFLDIKMDSSTYGSGRKESIEKVLSECQLLEHKEKVPRELSGGMKRKLSLAMAFAGDSKILILDEPSSGLDPMSRRLMWNTLRSRRLGRAVLLSTQHMEEADFLGDRITIMASGGIVACGSAVFLKTRLTSGYKIRLECNERNVNKIMNSIQQIFPNAKVTALHAKAEIREFEVLLNDQSMTNDEDADKVINVLQMIEDNKTNFGLDSFSLRSSSLDDVMAVSRKLHDQPKNKMHQSFKNTTNKGGFTIKSPSGSSTSSIENTLSTQLGISSAISPKSASPIPVDDETRNLLITLESLKGNYRRTYDPFESCRRIVAQIIYKHMSRCQIVPFLKYFIWQAFSIFLLKVTLSLNVEDDFILENSVCTACVLRTYNQIMAEKISGFKTIQLSSNLRIFEYWLAFLVSDTAKFIPIWVFTGMLFGFSGYEMQHTWMVVLATVLFGLSSCLFIYALSTQMNTKDFGTVLIINIAPPLVQFILGLLFKEALKVSLPSWYNNIFVVFLSTMPFYPYTRIIAYYNWHRYNKGKIYPYENTLSFQFIILSVQIIIYVFILIVADMNKLDLFGIFKNARCYICSGPTPTSKRVKFDDDVASFTTKARNLISKPIDVRTKSSLVVNDLSKRYSNRIQAVDDLNFIIQEGECFGLLGANGAGKSTTFSIVSGNLSYDNGKIMAFRSFDTSFIRRFVGYDPEDSPIATLTPKDALKLMATMRGVERGVTETDIIAFLRLLEMDEHADKAIVDLSGGTRQKLALAMALMGCPAMLMLDEPTAGIDPMARIKVWNLFNVMRVNNDSSILIASHAMEECEAICSNISIMMSGSLRCVGSLQHLRTKFNQGITIKIQLVVDKISAAFKKLTYEAKTADDRGVNYGEPDNVGSQLFQDIFSNLSASYGSGSVIVDDIGISGASYRVVDIGAKKSSLFRILSQMKKSKKNFYFTIDDTSLDEVFVFLANEHEKAI